MTIKEILQKAKIKDDGTLDESIVSELETFVSELVDIKVKDKAAQMLKEAVEPTVAEARKTLTEEYEAKFEEFKDTVSRSFSNFIDQTLDEELEIPEKIKEYAHIGERYAPLMQEIRTRMAVDEGAVDEEAKEILKEAKGEIETLREQLNKAIGESIETKRDAEALAATLYLRKKCDGLNEVQKSRMIGILAKNVVMKFHLLLCSTKSQEVRQCLLT